MAYTRRAIVATLVTSLGGCVSSGDANTPTPTKTPTPTETICEEGSIPPTQRAVGKYENGYNVYGGAMADLGGGAFVEHGVIADGTALKELSYGKKGDSEQSYRRAIEKCNDEKRSLNRAGRRFQTSIKIAESCVDEGSDDIITNAELGVDACLAAIEWADVIIEEAEAGIDGTSDGRLSTTKHEEAIDISSEMIDPETLELRLRQS